MRSKHWPPRWTKKNGAIYYVVPPDQRDRWEGKSWYRLGRTEPEAWAAWFARTEAPQNAPTTVSQAVLRYRGEAMPSLAASTQRQYSALLARIDAGFGHMRPRDIQPAMIYAARDRMAPVQGNRMVAVLSALLSACVRWGALDRNPCREVRRTTEKPRRRYVTDEEVAAFVAGSSPVIRAWVGLKLATGLRQGMMLSLDESDWSGEELTVAGAKGGMDAVFYGGGLADAVGAVLALPHPRFGPLFRNRNGDRYTPSGFRALWQYAMAKHVERGGQRFTEHDLRAKVASDSETVTEAQQRMQHRTAAMTVRVYRRRPERVKAV